MRIRVLKFPSLAVTSDSEVPRVRPGELYDLAAQTALLMRAAGWVRVERRRNRRRHQGDRRRVEDRRVGREPSQVTTGS